MSNLETEAKLSRETPEIARESKEKETDPELAAAASMERADYLVREVKTSKNQMQNIVLHIQVVLKAIRDLRQAMELPESGDMASVEQDKKRVQALQAKISEYRSELIQMKDQLITEQISILREKNPNQPESLLEAEAKVLIERMLGDVEDISN